jgi:hypothetical protein
MCLDQRRRHSTFANNSEDKSALAFGARLAAVRGAAMLVTVSRMSNVKSVVKRGTFVALMLALSAAPALATPIVFTTSGTGAGSDHQLGKATFTFSATTFTVTLDNLTSPTSFTDQELDGLTFDLTGPGSASLTSVSAPKIVDCSSAHSTPCPAFAGTPPVNDGWGATTTSGATTLTTVPLGFHPYAIINSDYTVAKKGNGNLNNPQHNPFLVGPVTFTFSGSFTNVSNVKFDWGTGPFVTVGKSGGSTTPPVPEPGSVVLLGTSLLGAATLLRRRFLL